VKYLLIICEIVVRVKQFCCQGCKCWCEDQTRHQEDGTYGFG